MTAAGLEVRAVHGWGYSSEAWARWAKLFPPGADFQSFDRGYFGAPRDMAWRDGHPGEDAAPPPVRILFLHSMAPLFLPAEAVARADVVVLFGGFQHFHPAAPESAASSSRDVTVRMREALAHDPGKVIESFHRRCALPGRGGAIAGRNGGGPPREGGVTDPSDAIAEWEGRMNLDLLTADLDRLDSEEIDFDAVRTVPRILVFHGTGDRIVPHSRGEALARVLGGTATFLPIEGAGHALPFTHSDRVWKVIAPLVAAHGFTGVR